MIYREIQVARRPQIGSATPGSIKLDGEAGSADCLEVDCCAHASRLESKQAPSVRNLHPPAGLACRVLARGPESVVWLWRQRTLKSALRTGGKQLNFLERIDKSFGGLVGSGSACRLQNAIAIRIPYWGQDADRCSSTLDGTTSQAPTLLRNSRRHFCDYMAIGSRRAMCEPLVNYQTKSLDDIEV